jgi:HAD superfamily hydrolase (TIGR01484 family)
MSSHDHDTTGVLATDLDGTLIPLEGNEENCSDLHTLARELTGGRVPLLFVTGRHFQSVAEAMGQYDLPLPDWVICDVGTSIYERTSAGTFTIVATYHQHLQQVIASLPIQELHEQLQSIKSLRLQEPEKQGSFKLSYYADSAQLPEVVAAVKEGLDRINAPYSTVSSVDPFTDDGLIDLLPRNVSKAYALAWWVDYTQLTPEALVFAGDSGNDLAALTAGYRAIVVANAHRDVAHAAEEAHVRSGWNDRIFLAKRTATSGLLEGCRRFGLI